MQYAKLGKSDLMVSRLGLGCMSFGVPARGTHPWTLTLEDSEPIIAGALELGINFFDTANVYSLGASEEIIGSVLKKLGVRSRVVLATKVYEPMSPDVLSGGLSRLAIFREIDASLTRLQTDYIDLYIVHRWDYHTPIQETMEALHDLVTLGKVRYIGASSMHTRQFAQAQHVADINGWPRFVSIQSHYNLINREEEREMLPYCLEEKIGVTPWSPLARGKLANSCIRVTKRSNTDKVQSWLYESAIDSDRQTIAAIHEIAKARGVTNAQVALAWLLAQPGIVSPIIGATKIGQLEDSVKSFDIALGKDELRLLEQFYVPHTTPEYI